MSRRFLFTLLRSVSLSRKRCSTINCHFYWNISRHLSVANVSSHSRDSKPNFENISDLTDYVNKQMFLHKPEEPKTTFTTAKLLNDCQSAEDVLTLIENMHRTNNLWNDEIIQYFSTLVDRTYTIFDTTEQEKVIKNVLNNENFHILLRRALLFSSQMLSSNLVEFLHCVGDLRIPKNSFVIKHIVEVMKKRINDFFPKDIALCHSVLMNYQFESPQVQALQKGLVLHLENMAKDEDCFVLCASDFYLHSVLSVAEFFGNNASVNLRRCLVMSIEKSLRMRRKEEMEFDLEIAVNVLVALGSIQYNHEQLLEKSINTILENSKDLSETQRLLLQKSLTNLNMFLPKDHEEEMNYLLSNDCKRLLAT